MAPTSAYISAPNSENKPVMTQIAINHTGEPTCAAMVAGFMKIPEPIMLPATMEVAAQYPILLFILLVHELRDHPVKMMRALFAGNGITPMSVEARTDTFLHSFHHFFIFQFNSVQVCARSPVQFIFFPGIGKKRNLARLKSERLN